VLFQLKMSLKKPVVLIIAAVFFLFGLLLADIFSATKNFNGYLIILSFTALFIGLLLFNMKYALFLLLFMRPVSEHFTDVYFSLPKVGQMLNFTSVISILIIIAGSLYLLINKPDILHHPLSKPLIAFVAVTFFSILFSTDKRDSLEAWLKVLSIFIVFLIAQNVIKEKKDLKQLAGVILASVIVPIAVAFYQLFTGTGNTETEGFVRVFGTFTHPLMLANYTLLVSMIILVFALGSKDRNLKLASYLVFVPLGIIFFNTYARGAWLTLIALLIILSVLKYRQLLVVLPVLLIIVALFSSGNIASRFEDLSSDGAAQGKYYANSLESREALWQKNFTLFLTSPVVGNGFGSSRRLVHEETHNDYLRVLTETGILGFIAYLWLLFAMVTTGWKSYKESSDKYLNNFSLAFFLIAVAYLILSLEGNILINGAFQWTFWSLAAVLFSAKLFKAEKALGV